MSSQILVKHKGHLYGGDRLVHFFVSMISKGINLHRKRCRIMHWKKRVAKGKIDARWGDLENSRAPAPEPLSTGEWQEKLNITEEMTPRDVNNHRCPLRCVIVSVRCEWVKEGFDLNDLRYRLPHSRV